MLFFLHCVRAEGVGLRPGPLVADRNASIKADGVEVQVMWIVALHGYHALSGRAGRQHIG